MQIEAQALVSGSESSQAQLFLLPALASDINDVNATPPNVNSPFGTDLDCGEPPPGLPLPDLGEQVARHTKGDAAGAKAERPAIRVLAKGRFERDLGLDDIIDRMFGAATPR